MNIKTIALILLMERLVSVFFIGYVIRRQLQLFKLPILAELRWFRIVLFLLSLAIMTGNLIPVVIDTLTLFADLSGRGNPSAIGVAYAVSNATTSILAALFVWIMYQMASAESTAMSVMRALKLERRKTARREGDKI